MSTILLISEDYVKTNSGLDDNTYGKFLMPAIKEAQEMGLQTIIGTGLYRAILAMVAEGTIADAENSDYKNLLDTYIQPYLLYKTIANVIPMVGTKLANIGTVVTENEHVVNLSKADRDYLVQQNTYKADFYCDLMQRYLCKNGSLYPEMKCDCEGYCPNLETSESSGLWLGGAMNPSKRY